MHLFINSLFTFCMFILNCRFMLVDDVILSKRSGRLRSIDSLAYDNTDIFSTTRETRYIFSLSLIMLARPSTLASYYFQYFLHLFFLYTLIERILHQQSYQWLKNIKFLFIQGLKQEVHQYFQKYIM